MGHEGLLNFVQLSESAGPLSSTGEYADEVEGASACFHIPVRAHASAHPYTTARAATELDKSRDGSSSTTESSSATVCTSGWVGVDELGGAGVEIVFGDPLRPRYFSVLEELTLLSPLIVYCPCLLIIKIARMLLAPGMMV